MAIRVIEILTEYHARLLVESRGDPLFDVFDNPMPLTIGRLEAGNWPATAPGQAELEGVLGLLPNKTAQQVMDEMTAAIVEAGGPDIAAMPASCDAWCYNNQLDIPTVVFGGGSLSVAHSNTEHIPLAELAAAAEVLVGTIIRWCGVSER